LEATTHAIELAKYSASFLGITAALKHERHGFGLATYLLASPLFPACILNAAFFHASMPLPSFLRDSRTCTAALSACSWKGMDTELGVLRRMIEYGESVGEGERREMERSIGRESGRTIEEEAVLGFAEEGDEGV
jgi:hypothetical protein